uniref:Anti-microbial protein n=1 Tax=Pinus monticola TaxID=3345 RepID=J9Q7X1_PINMO|nr:anti-microbial protein [Pinus monticola]
METKHLAYMMFVLVSLFLAMAQPSQASYFSAWAGPGCNNHNARYNKCGCSNIGHNVHEGYEFVYQGQAPTAYNTNNYKGVAQTRFSSNVNQACNNFAWKSVFIQC